MDPREAIERELALEPDVRLAYLFGSRATGKNAPDSDWDLAVVFERGASPGRDLALAAHLGDRLGIRCDVVSLETAPIEFAARVILTGQRLALLRDDPVEFEAKILARASVQRPVLDAQHREIVEGSSRARAMERYRKALGTPRRLPQQA